MKRFKKFGTALLSCMMLTASFATVSNMTMITVEAHPGRTDAQGGHHDYKIYTLCAEWAVGKPGLQIKIGDGRENHALVSQRQLHGFFSPHPSKSTPARKKQSAIPDLPYTPAPSESS